VDCVQRQLQSVGAQALSWAFSVPRQVWMILDVASADRSRLVVPDDGGLGLHIDLRATA